MYKLLSTENIDDIYIYIYIYVHRLVDLYHTEKAKARIRESVKRTKFLKKGGDKNEYL